VVLLTKSKTVTSTVLVIERQVDNNNDERNEKNEYIAGGEHSGIVISKFRKYGK
jgi:hypothetical protein